MKYLIADLVTEFQPRFDNLKNLAKPFLYCGDRASDLKLKVSDEWLNKLHGKMEEGVSLEETEEFAYACAFNKAILPHFAMLVHSSGIIYENKAYLFSAPSGGGKSTHTGLLCKAYGDRLHIFNDDKPIVRAINGKPIAFGTPFDGGSGIALNESAELKAIVFLEKGEKNSISIPNTKEIIKRLYLSTSFRSLSKSTAADILSLFDILINQCSFYLLTCNTDISAAHFSYDNIINI